MSGSSKRIWSRVAVVMAALMVGLVVTACGSSGGSSSGGETSASTGGSTEAKATAGSEPIKLGAALALSGAFSPFDVEPLNTAKLWAAKTNAEGGIDGRQVEFVEADTESEPANGPIAAKQVSSEGAEIVLVSCNYNFGASTALTAEAEGKVSMSVCAGSTG